MKKKILFLWKYLTDSEFRFWADLRAYNNYLLDMRRMFEYNQRLSYHKMWGSGIYPPDITDLRKVDLGSKYNPVNHDGFKN